MYGGSANVEALTPFQQCATVCKKPELALNAPHLMQEEIIHQYYEDVKVVNPINDNCIEFLVSGTPDFIDLAKTYLQLKVKIVKESSGADMVAADKVGPVNNFFNSLFSQVDVSINNTLVSSNDNLYPYRSYLELLLSYGKEAKDTQLASLPWIDDDAGRMDDVDPLATVSAEDATPASTVNFALKARRALFLKGEYEMSGRLHSDMFHQTRLLPSYCAVRLKLVRTKPSFSLQSKDGGFKVEITDAKLMVKRITVHPDRLLTIEHQLAGPYGATYPIKQVDVKTFTIPQGVSSWNQTLYMGKLPSRLFLAMVKNTALNGAFTENPFNFQHFKTKCIKLHVNNHLIERNTDYEKGQYLQSYLALGDALNKMFRNDSFCIKREDYANGYTIQGYDLTPDASCGHSSAPESGAITAEILFGASLAAAVSLICFAEFDSMISIDKNRNCTRLQ